MNLYTIGFTKKSARSFFESIKTNGIKMLIDIRINNSSQLAGFSKGSDLEYFLDKICNCRYKHEIIFAPTQEIMDSGKSKKISLEIFEKLYSELMETRNSLNYFIENYSSIKNICLLCSEDTPDNCHRRVLANLLLKTIPGVSVKHL